MTVDASLIDKDTFHWLIFHSNLNYHWEKETTLTLLKRVPKNNLLKYNLYWHLYVK